jgi:hypothetical protein
MIMPVLGVSWPNPGYVRCAGGNPLGVVLRGQDEVHLGDVADVGRVRGPPGRNGHSCLVSRVSTANACRWPIKLASSWRRRGSGVPAQAASTCPVSWSGVITVRVPPPCPPSDPRGNRRREGAAMSGRHRVPGLRRPGRPHGSLASSRPGDGSPAVWSSVGARPARFPGPSPSLNGGGAPGNREIPTFQSSRPGHGFFFAKLLGNVGAIAHE